MTSLREQVYPPSRRDSTHDGGVRYRARGMEELTAAEIEHWLELRASNSALDSPYFHPRFAAAVASTRPGVRVIIGEDSSGAITSFLPVQLDGRTFHPAGFPAADFQGPVCALEADFDILAALASCPAASYEFDHMRDGIAAFDRWIFGRERSPCIDVSGGLSDYLARAPRSGREKMAEARRGTRRAESEYGPIQFVAESRDEMVLDAVLALKRRQYSATGSRDYFADPRHVELVRCLLGERGTDFGGMLSALYAGPHLLAAHFGLRAGRVLHWWFPVYDPQFSRLSPGWTLLRAVIDAAPELGLERIDLGRGVDDYKRRAMTGYQVVCQGAVIRNPLRRHAALGQRRALAALKASRAAPAMRAAAHYIRRRAH